MEDKTQQFWKLKQRLVGSGRREEDFQEIVTFVIGAKDFSWMSEVLRLLGESAIYGREDGQGVRQRIVNAMAQVAKTFEEARQVLCEISSRHPRWVDLLEVLASTMLLSDNDPKRLSARISLVLGPIASYVSGMSHAPEGEEPQLNLRVGIVLMTLGNRLMERYTKGPKG